MGFLCNWNRPFGDLLSPQFTHNDAVRAAVVAAGDGAETLLPCCVPLVAVPKAATNHGQDQGIDAGKTKSLCRLARPAYKHR